LRRAIISRRPELGISRDLARTIHAGSSIKARDATRAAVQRVDIEFDANAIAVRVATQRAIIEAGIWPAAEALDALCPTTACAAHTTVVGIIHEVDAGARAEVLACRAHRGGAGRDATELLADLAFTTGNPAQPTVVRIKLDLDALAVTVIETRLHASCWVSAIYALATAARPAGHAAYAALTAIELIRIQVAATTGIAAERFSTWTRGYRRTHSSTAELISGARYLTGSTVLGRGL
jgi:hypothetical protein